MASKPYEMRSPLSTTLACLSGTFVPWDGVAEPYDIAILAEAKRTSTPTTVHTLWRGDFALVVTNLNLFKSMRRPSSYAPPTASHKGGGGFCRVNDSIEPEALRAGGF